MKGIKSAAGVQILGGSFTIDAADDALHSDVSMTICGGSFRIASGDDALHLHDDVIVVTTDTQLDDLRDILQD